ncbi:uncharacterized protein RAG0_08193 [Rhynchosporium agropyri]|uniref:Uncharacterized protein n=1 Tax=Rhynchosporium agropyri TaxID=914238 RepID=A0A1E1KPJ9_9HELO|nr:uncharacterized protein RAG0_08193 [Rhynchosporium agropyri]
MWKRAMIKYQYIYWSAVSCRRSCSNWCAAKKSSYDVRSSRNDLPAFADLNESEFLIYA